MSLLEINIGEAGYGNKVVLTDINIKINEGSINAFIGPNGAGKSTLLKAVVNLSEIHSGRIHFEEEDITKLTTEKKVKKGISFVPQGNRVFNDLTVFENLEAGGFLIKNKNELKNRIEEVLNVFPDLKFLIKKDAGNLSGGEKQQLAISRALMLKPKILMLDEPSLGLSPQLVNTAMEKIKQINKESGTTILIVEQKVREVLKIADTVYALRLGKIIFSGTPDEFSEEKLKEVFIL